MKTILRISAFLVLGLTLVSPCGAQLRLPAIFGEHMVLQQGREIPIWGWDNAGTRVTVTFGEDTATATAAEDGSWKAVLRSAAASSDPRTLTVRGSSTVEFRDVLVGEVWVCSGQSNMVFPLNQDVNGDLEAMASDIPGLRLIRVPPNATQEPQRDFKGEWRLSTRQTAGGFSDVAVRFGRYLHAILKTPVGLIETSWGGSRIEAWIPRSALENDPRFDGLIQDTKERERVAQSPEGRARFQRSVAVWRVEEARRKAEGKKARGGPQDWLTSQFRPGNLYAGVLNPVVGYGIRGVIWYQGEANASNARDYGALFPFMIEQWRKQWGQGDFSFYWVQLPRYRPRMEGPGNSTWAEMREAQTRALALPATGQAVTIDLGEANNIHPRHKYDVAARLVRWALAKDYGIDLRHRSPEFRNVVFHDRVARVRFDCHGESLHTRDVAEVLGFEVAGSDRIWHPAKARLSGTDEVEVGSDRVSVPVAVRYAWADNPVCNLFSARGLPVTSFRTEEWPALAAP